MKKKIFAILAAVIVGVMNMQYFYVYSHDITTPYSWYLKFEKPNTPPAIQDLSGFASDYGMIYRDTSGNKKIYLTFDVGYDDGNVKPILDALKAHNAKAAFFVLPHFVTACPELVSQMISDGHLICNHTTHHKDMSKVTDEAEFAAELRGVEDTFREATGKEMAKFFRPPEGKFNERTLELAQKLGYRTTFWSLAYADWDKNKQPDREKALGILLSRVHDGCVLLLHPTSATNAAIMDTLLSEFEARGYSFARLDEFPQPESKGSGDTTAENCTESGEE